MANAHILVSPSFVIAEGQQESFAVYTANTAEDMLCGLALALARVCRKRDVRFRPLGNVE